MSGCCGAGSSCCTASAAARRVGHGLTLADKLGMARMRLGIGRASYRVEPGLYALGEPDATAPVLVTGNYKFTFDVVRSAASGVDAWLLVLDTKGINVWCAAGKQTFGTRELCSRIMQTRLDEVVDHRTLILPQLGAPGVAAHEVTAFTEFEVVYGPVRAHDIPAFLAAGLVATPEMRRVTFGVRDRAALIGVELAAFVRPRRLAGVAALVAASGLTADGFTLQALFARGATLLVAAVGGVLAAAATMVALPWLPFRSFAAKGALAGGAAGAALVWFAAPYVGWLAATGAGLACAVLASYEAMNYTGSSAITSPSGVEHEMRRAIPAQAVAALLAVVLWIASAFMWTSRGV